MSRWFIKSGWYFKKVRSVARCDYFLNWSLKCWTTSLQHCRYFLTFKVIFLFSQGRKLLNTNLCNSLICPSVKLWIKYMIIKYNYSTWCLAGAFLCWALSSMHCTYFIASSTPTWWVGKLNAWVTWVMRWGGCEPQVPSIALRASKQHVPSLCSFAS